MDCEQILDQMYQNSQQFQINNCVSKIYKWHLWVSPFDQETSTEKNKKHDHRRGRYLEPIQVRNFRNPVRRVVIW
jgi:hypothetical protein